MSEVLRLSHVCVRVVDMEKSLFFYRDLLGFHETEKNGDYIYLRGYEEGQHHSLVLKRAESPGLSYIAYRVRNVDKIKEKLEATGLKTRKFEEKGVDNAIIFSDIGGIPTVFYENMEYVDDIRMKFHIHKGVSPIRLAHVNLMVDSNVFEDEIKFYQSLGFYETEIFLDKEGKKMISWLSKSGDSHDLAISKSSKKTPGFHHFTYYVHDLRDVIRAADIMASAELWDYIERGPGRHGVTQGVYIYLRDPNGGRLEFFTGDYVVLDPDKWKPVVWTYEQFRYRSDYWSRPIPESWLNEWIPVEDPFTGNLRGWNT
ncbi:3,4-dihydroxyphenylacetate 2,3-dioxygenase [Sulfolobus acidocaldarius SUSAZ]|nr:3,4-dihydroxyphenylacetate 2,3-dioxygenase [Sulfolobus acidocaldarius SUSAZ]